MLYVLIISLTFQAIAAGLCFYHYKKSRQEVGWLIMTVGFLGHLFRRVYVLCTIVAGSQAQIVSELMATINSFLIFVAVFLIVIAETKKDRALREINTELQKRIKEYDQ